MASLWMTNDMTINALDAVLDLLNSGGNATLTVYGDVGGTVSAPLSADHSIGSASTIISYTMADPCFAGASMSGNSAVAALVATGLTGVSTGGNGDNILFIRIESGDSANVIQLDVSTTGQGGAVQFDSLGPVSLGQTVTISSGTVSMDEIAS